MSEAWSQWEGQTIDGRFLLKQYLGSARQSAVFLTEICPRDTGAGQLRDRKEEASRQPGDRKDLRGPEPIPLAVKLIAADQAHAASQLSRWRLAQILSHPNLLRVFDAGHCRLGPTELIFGVMEYAEENLAQIIPERALTIDETRQMLEPALDALRYLHGQGLVHGGLKPANVMAMGDQIKLASDWISPEKEAVCGPQAASAYDAPETAAGTKAAASDVWSLGMILSEALTQRLPAQSGLKDPATDPRLPDNFPAPFVEIVRGCLRRDPLLRWTVAGITAWLHPEASSEPVPAGAEPVLVATEPAPVLAAAGTQRLSATPQTHASPRPAMRYEPVRQKQVLSPEKAALQEPPVAAPMTMSGSVLPSPSVSAATMSRQAPARNVRQPLARVETKSTRPFAPLDFLSWTVPLVRRFAVPALVAIAALAALYAGFGLLRHESKTASPGAIPPAKPQQQAVAPQKPQPGSSRSQTKPSPRSGTSSAENKNRNAQAVVPETGNAGAGSGQELGVVQQVLPPASQSALATIQGTVRVSVKVKVDSAGNATGAELVTPGPSPYFARLSQQAAEGWRFNPGQASGRSFLLHFEFRNSGVKAYAARAGG